MKAAEKIETAVVSYEEKALAEYRITPAEIAKKAAEYMVIKVKPDDAQSYKVARAALTACVSTRTSADKRRKELKADALKWGKAVDDAYRALIAPLAPVEEYLDKELGREDGRRADIKAKKAEEERLRVEGIRARITALQNIPLSLPGKPIADLNATFDRVFSEEITEAVYMEFTAEATGLKDSVLDAISAAIEAREKADKEAAERRAEAERLEKIRQEQEAVRKAQEAEAKRLDDLRKAEEEKTRKEREAIEAEKRKIQEDKDRAEFEAKAKDRAEAEARAKVEAEAKAKAEAEAKAAAEKARQEALRSDKEKLLAFALELQMILMPTVSDEKARDIIHYALNALDTMAKEIKERAEAL